jgi:nucleotide-binding universal stress UspA family protein
MFNQVLVPLDGSPLAEKALPYAQAILSPQGRLTLLSVVDIPRVAFPISPSPPLLRAEIEHYQTHPQARLAAAESYLQHIAEGLADARAQIDTLTVVAEEVASTIIKVCNDLAIEVLVIATHGHSGLDRWLLGSVTQKVLQIAPCPILVIPSKVAANRMDRATE